MKTVLLPTDFSENSINAITYALQLCKQWDCTFYVLNVQKQSEFILDDLMTTPTNTSIHEAIADDNKEELEVFISKIKKQNTNKNHRFISLFDYNNLTDAISKIVTSKKIDLIIMGTNGATGAKEVLFGSNTLNTIRTVNCAILTIPEHYTFSDINTVLFSTDNYQENSKEGINPLLKIINTYDAKLSVLNIDFANYQNDKKDYSSHFKTLFKNLPYTFLNIKEVPYPMVISTITQLYSYNIHALFIKPRTFLQRFIYGSVTNEISYNSNLPLLILRQ